MIDALTHTAPFVAAAFLIAGALSFALPQTVVADPEELRDQGRDTTQ
ncbi:MAG: hypothetical protein WBP81_38755 [Solirubrobacteraceae bacterium]